MSAIQPTPGCTPIGASANLDARTRTVSNGREDSAGSRQVERNQAAGRPGVPTPEAGDTPGRRSEFVNTRLSFGYDEESGRVYVQIVRSDTGEVVRQRPPESMLEMLAQIREMIGLILDEKA